MRRWLALLLFPAFAAPAAGQTQGIGQPPRPGSLIVVFPFDNKSRAPGLDWVAESFPEVLGARLVSSKLLVVNRADRTYAFDRAGIPAGARISRATLLRMAENMDVDYAIVGSYGFDGRTFSARSQLIDVKRARLLPETAEAGALTQLLEIQSTLAWNLLRQLGQVPNTPKSTFVSAATDIRLDALEHYVRGVIASNRADRLKFLREAVRFSPNYPEANLQLGKALLDTNQYDAAIAALTRVPVEGPLGAEAQFFLGLAFYLSRKYDRAESAFRFVAERVPLIEVYNNLGVVTAHNGKVIEARRYFERVTQADAREPDYRFNLGVTLYRLGDYAGAQRQLQEALALRPQDADAKIALQAATIGTPYPQESSTTKPPQERIKRNYDEASFHQLEAEIDSLLEERYALLPPSEHAVAHVKNGSEMLSDGRLEQADTSFREAILLDPGNVQAHIGLARVLETRNELSEARAEAMAANRLQVTVDAFLIIARLELKQNRLDAASENLVRALKIDPGNAEAAALQAELEKRKSSAGTAQE